MRLMLRHLSESGVPRYEATVDAISKVAAARRFANDHFLDKGAHIEVMEWQRVVTFRVTDPKTDARPLCRLVEEGQGS